MVAIGWLLIGMAVLSITSALRMIATIGRPRSGIRTGGEAAVATVFSAAYAIIFILTGLYLIRGL